jgi:hypothetical protein
MTGGSVVVIVGPNNVGESRELNQAFANPARAPPPEARAVVSGVLIAKLVDDAGFVEWVREKSHVATRGGQELVARMNAGEVQLGQAQGWWGSAPPFGQIGPYFVLYATTDARLGLVGGVPSYDPNT